MLWTLSLLALIGTQLAAAGRGEAQIGRNLVDATTLEAATEGAVQTAIFELLAQRWVANGTEHVVPFGPAMVTLRLEDEGGKINPNIASEALLSALLLRVGAQAGQAASLANAIVDWRTAAVRPLPGGAKGAQYSAAGREYGPPGTNFRSIDELGLVLGITPALLAGLRPHMTIFSDNDPNGATRDPVVAAALADLGVEASGAARVARITSVIAVARDKQHGAYAVRVIIRLNAQTDRHPYERLGVERLASN